MGWIKRLALWIVVLIGWLSAAGMGLWALGMILEPGWSLGKVLNVILAAGAAVQLPGTALMLQRAAGGNPKRPGASGL